MTLGAHFVTFSDFAKKGAHHEFICHGEEIEGRALGKARKKHSKIEEKTEEKQARKNNAFFSNFGLILGGFWEHFGSQKAFKTRVKFWMRF